jgi:hypothetical protein
LECGGSTPPCSFELHTDRPANQIHSLGWQSGINLETKAATSRRTPRCFRHGQQAERLKGNNTPRRFLKSRTAEFERHKLCATLLLESF